MASEWLGTAARTAITDVVRAIEARTSAEIVVTVRARSDAYRHVDFALGAALALAALLVYVYAPTEFPDDPAPPVIVAFFVLGALISSAVPAVQRLFLSRRTRKGMVRRAAREAFVDQNVARTRSRKGVLVYLSLLEREVEVITDVGVDLGEHADEWNQHLGELEKAARAGSGVGTMIERLGALGSTLARSMPVDADDLNELPDAPA